MNRTTKTTAALLTVSALGLTACGDDGGGGDDGDVTLTMLAASYSDQTGELWEEVIASFEEESPGVTIDLEMQSWENINDVITARIQGHQAPDILSIDAFADYADDGLLYSAEEILSEETVDDFQETFVENASMDGEQYGFPLLASARALFVNDDLLEEAGVDGAPSTWDELYDAAEAVSEETDAYGYGLPLGSEEAQAEAGLWFFGAGGGYGDENEITVDSPENIEAAEFMQSLSEDGLTQPDAGSTQRTPMLDQFIQGQFGMAMGLPQLIGMIDERNPELNYSIHDIPTQDGEQVTLGVADHLMAFRNDEDKGEQIGAFIDHFYRTENYVAFIDAEGFLPTTISGAEETSDEDVAPFADALSEAQFYPSVNPAWADTQAALQTQMGRIASGDDPAEVLEEIQAEAGE